MPSKIRQVVLLFIFIIFIFTPSIPVTANSQETDRKQLTVLTWSDYMDMEIVKQFEEDFATEIKFVYYEEDDERDAIMVESDGLGYDLILINGIRVSQYEKSGWITSITEQSIPNLKYINKKWRKSFRATETHGIPYFWGTLGIAYRTDLVKEKITSWKQLYEPDESLKGKIFMLSTQRDIIGSALKSLGYSINSTNTKEIDEAKTLLRQQKPFVNKYGCVSVDERSPLVTGESWLAITFNGDAIMLKEHNENIQYVLPKEGSNIWVDYFTVSTQSKNKKLAMQFLNFINEPKIAAQNAGFVYFATPNSEAEKYLPLDFLNNPVIYPSKSNLNKSEFYIPLPLGIIRHRNAIVTGLKK